MSRNPDHIPTSDQLLEHAGAVRGLALAILGDRHAAEDVVQDAWVAALTRPPRHSERLGGWLYRVTGNLARMRLRSGARRRTRESGAVPAARPPSPEEVVSRIETQERLLAAVRSLEEPYRTAVVLRFFEGLTPSDISVRLAVPVKTVHTRIRRALEMLRARLERDRARWRAGLLVLAGVKPSLALGGVLMSVKTKVAAIVSVVLLGAAAVGTSLYLPTTEETPVPDRGEEPPALVVAEEPEEQPFAEAAPAEPVAPVETPEADTPWKIYVEVLQADGEPAAMAYLSFFGAGGTMEGGANADRDGKATVAAKGAGHLVVGGVDGHRPRHVPDLVPPGSGELSLRVQLEPGLTIRGRVLDHEGVGARRIHVHSEFVARPDWLDENLSVSRARTDREGRFELTGLLPGRYRVHTKLYGASLTASAAKPVVADAGATDVELRLGGPILDFVKIHLFDAASGAPFEGRVEVRTVTAKGEAPCSWGEVAREHPVIHARVPLEERVRIRILAEGYRPVDTEELLLGPNDGAPEIVVRLDPDPESLIPLTLVLEDDRGDPVEKVTLYRRSPIGDAWHGRTLYAPGGRLALRLPEGTHHFRIRDPGGVSADPGVIEHEFALEMAAGGPPEKKVPLVRGGTVDITYPPDVVTYPSGAVLERTGVFVKTTGGEHLQLHASGRHVAGRRRLVGVPPGRVVVVFKHGDGSHTEKTVRIRPGETTEVAFEE